MAISIVNNSGSGKIKDDSLVSFSYSEDATPIDPMSSAGSISQVTFSGVEETSNWDGTTHPNSKLMINNSLTVTDSDFGSVQVAVKKIDINSGGLATITGDSLLEKLNTEKTAQPFHGDLAAAITYYCSLCGITPTFGSYLSQFQAISVNYVGWSGNVWDYLKMLCAATSLSTSNRTPIEAYFTGTNLGFRPVGGTAIDIDLSVTDFGQSISSNDSALNISIYNYNTSYAVDQTIYSVLNYSDTVNEDRRFLSSILENMSVGAGETLVKLFTMDTSLFSIKQPDCVSLISPLPFDPSTSPGKYVIVGNDGLPVKPEQWVAQGGSLTVALTGNPNEIELTLVAPADSSVVTADDSTKYTYAPYRIGVETSGDNVDYPALFLVGTGVKYNKVENVFLTGSDSGITSTDKAKVIDNPFVIDAFTTTNAGLAAAQSACGPNMAFNGSSAPNGFSFGTSIGGTFVKNNVKLRLSSLNYDTNSISWGANKYTTFADFDTKNTGKTFANFDTVTGGSQPVSFNEFSIIPLIES